MAKRIFIFALLSLLGLWPAYGQQPKQGDVAKLSARQIEAEIDRLRKEIAAVRQSPEAPEEWKEKLRIEARLAGLKAMRWKEQEPFATRLHSLSTTDGFRAWTARIGQLEEQLKALDAARYAMFRATGRELMRARHAELAKLADAETPRLRELKLDVLSYPRMGGSTSTQPLATLIACRCFGASYEWVGHEQALSATRRPITIDGPRPRAEPESSLMEFTLRAKTDMPANERLGTIINSMLATNASTHEAYVDLIEGRSDIGLLARGPSEDELKLAREKRAELEAVACARDALVFLVNEKNPVQNLTSVQIRAIYSGQMGNWKSIGGVDQPIAPLQREENSGSQELMRKLVMKDVPMAKPQGEYDLQMIASGMAGPFLRVTVEEEAVGFSVHYYERYMSGSPRTKVIAVDGVVPSYESILESRYPYISDVLVVTRKDSGAQSPAKRLRDWLLTAEGQAVVRESGYVPVRSGVLR